MLIKRYVKMNTIGAKWKRITKQWNRKTRHLYLSRGPSIAPKKPRYVDSGVGKRGELTRQR